MILGLDFDGVIVDPVRLHTATAADLLGIHLPPGMIHRRPLVEAEVLTEAQWAQLMAALYDSRDWRHHLHPLAGAFDSMRRLLDDGHSIRVVTDRTGLGLELAGELLCEAGLTVELVGVPHGRTKTNFVAGCAAYADDRPDKLTPLAAGGQVPHLFLFDWPFNRMAPAAGWRRVLGWTTFMDQLAAMLPVGIA